jgi:hypothetical protein
VKVSTGASRRLITALAGAAFLSSMSANAAVVTAPIKPGDRYYRLGPEQCVIYARAFVSSLPFGLHDYNDKLRIINSTVPRRGNVAVINLGKVGHVAVVVSVDNSGSSRSIQIAEMNVPLDSLAPRYRYATCGANIADCEAQLKIVGYFRP